MRVNQQMTEFKIQLSQLVATLQHFVCNRKCVTYLIALKYMIQFTLYAPTKTWTFFISLAHKMCLFQFSHAHFGMYASVSCHYLHEIFLER